MIEPGAEQAAGLAGPAGVDAGLPVFEDAAAWTGPAMAAGGQWIELLTPAEIVELSAAVDDAIGRRLDLVTLTEGDVRLPTLGPRLHALRRELLHGRGFALLRGWPSADRSLEQNAFAFRIVGAWLGEALSQNARGHVLGHVADLGLDYAAPGTRGYQTTAELRYHTDGGDIVGLLCVRPARAGGLSKICSSTTVWNELVRRRPDAARLLLQPFYFSRVGENHAGQRPWFRSPVFTPCGGRMIAVLIRSFIQKAQAFDDVPRLTAAQIEALDLVDALADDPALRLDMDFRPGDMQFLCNHSVFHSRTAYEDWPEPGRRRHLLRLWMASADGPELPADMTTKFQGRTDSGRPNGIRLPGQPLVAPLEPV